MGWRLSDICGLYCDVKITKDHICKSSARFMKKGLRLIPLKWINWRLCSFFFFISFTCRMSYLPAQVNSVLKGVLKAWDQLYGRNWRNIFASTVSLQMEICLFTSWLWNGWGNKETREFYHSPSSFQVHFFWLKVTMQYCIQD